MTKAVVSWSGGKDSCAAYHRAIREFDVIAAITMVNEDGSRSRSHGLRPELLTAQVERLAVSHIVEPCSWSTYDAGFERALAAARDLGATHVIYGDILFEEHRQWALQRAECQGLISVEPLWGHSTLELYRSFLALGGRARIVTVRSSELDDSFLGRELNEALLHELIALGVDPCGERGEYHTFVTDCPAFASPVSVRACGRGGQSGCVSEDLVLDERASGAA
jgi:uncharacterized protein (TIGR00290 family)